MQLRLWSWVMVVPTEKIFFPLLFPGLSRPQSPALDSAWAMAAVVQGKWCVQLGAHTLCVAVSNPGTRGSLVAATLHSRLVGLPRRHAVWARGLSVLPMPILTASPGPDAVPPIHQDQGGREKKAETISTWSCAGSRGRLGLAQGNWALVVDGRLSRL